MRKHLPLSPARFAIQASRDRWHHARHLQVLDDELMAMFRGEFDRLLVAMPPRHGKSELCSKYLPAWFVGTHPERRVILTSYESDFAESWGRKARGLLAEYGKAFGVSLSGGSQAAHRWDLEGHAGGMVSLGVGGAITGRGADLLIVDDPVKNAEQALSRKRHENTWDWWESTALSRLEPQAHVVVMQTRWHEDDLAGRLVAHSQRDDVRRNDAEQAEGTSSSGPTWRILSFPALAEQAEPCGRKVGEALWPERWPRAELEEVREHRRPTWWSALYQQQPVPPGGLMFRRDALSILTKVPFEVRRAVRFWDKASSEGAGDYTVGVLMLACEEGFVVADVTRVQMSAGERDKLIMQKAAEDEQAYPAKIETWIEQEPGSGGKDSAQATLRKLQGYRARAERPSGNKTARADPLAAQVEAGNVWLLHGAWNQAYLEELAHFPFGRHDDQVDASSGAFNRLAAPHKVFEVWTAGKPRI